MECYWSLKRCQEQPHLLKAEGSIRTTSPKPPTAKAPPLMNNGISTTMHGTDPAAVAVAEGSGGNDNNLGDDDEDDSDDDDFAAEMEMEFSEE